VDIYYSQEEWSSPKNPYQIKSNLLLSEPRNLLTELKGMKEFSDSPYLKCYGGIDELKKIYVIRSDIDINIVFENGGYWIDRYGQDFAEWFMIPSEAYSTYNLNYSNIFFSEKSVKMTQLPPFFHNTPLSEKAHNVIATFDISKWFRKVNLGLILKKPNEKTEVNIKVGDPLYYLRFDTDEKINFKQFMMTEELYKVQRSCVGLKEFRPFTPLNKAYQMFMSNRYNDKVIKQIKNNLM
jgi:hypothetical protein